MLKLNVPFVGMTIEENFCREYSTNLSQSLNKKGSPPEITSVDFGNASASKLIVPFKASRDSSCSVEFLRLLRMQKEQ